MSVWPRLDCLSPAGHVSMASSLCEPGPLGGWMLLRASSSKASVLCVLTSGQSVVSLTHVLGDREGPQKLHPYFEMSTP